MLITVARTTNQLEAHIISGRLKVEGIRTYIAYEHHVSIQWHMSVALGDVRVQVHSSDYDKAQETLIAIDDGEYVEALENEYSTSDSVMCPSCKSSDTHPVAWPWKLAIFIGFIMQFHLPYTRHYFRCTSCSTKWIAHKQRPYPLHVLIFWICFLCFISFVIFEIWVYWCKLNCKSPDIARYLEY